MALKVPVTTPGGTGHLHPMVPLARALMARGSDVLWALPDRVVAQVEQEWRPDLVVSDAAELAGPVVADELGVSGVTKGFGPLLPERRVARAEEELAPLWRSRGLEPRPISSVGAGLALLPGETMGEAARGAVEQPVRQDGYRQAALRLAPRSRRCPPRAR